MKVRFAAPASAELDAIYSYIVQHNPEAAQRINIRIRAVAEQLGEIPHIGRSTNRPNIRIRVVTPYRYLIYYTIKDDEIHILHIRHGARRPPADLAE
jgi:toxin ParE1/3/4